MTDLKLNSDNDIYLNDYNDFVIVDDDKEQFIQRLRIKLKTFKGEWFLNTDIGIDYFNEVFTNKSNIEKIKNIFKVAIMEEKESVKLKEFELTMDSDRKIFLYAFLETIFGNIEVTI
jgi:hypothetical protein